jgi:hypothetical protein
MQVHIIGYNTKPDPCMNNVTDEQHALADMEHG